MGLSFFFSSFLAKLYPLCQSDNLIENLLGDFEYEIQVPYLLYRNAAQEVNGIWFYNPRECEDVANLFNRYYSFLIHLKPFILLIFMLHIKINFLNDFFCYRILNAYSKVPSKPKVSSNKRYSFFSVTESTTFHFHFHFVKRYSSNWEFFLKE